MTSSAYSPILLEEEDSFEIASENHLQPGPKREKQPWIRSIFIHGALILLYTAIAIAVIRANSVDELSSHGWLPYDLGGEMVVDRCLAAIKGLTIKYQPQLVKNLTNNPFAGAPSPEIDETWGELLAPMNIRVSKAELDRNDQTSVALPEGGGYLAWLGAFHELHCIASPDCSETHHTSFR